MTSLSFHHFGIACRDLDIESGVYETLGYTKEREDFVDPIQGVQGRFLVGGGPRLELLTALDGHDVLEPWLEAGSRIYHQAFETTDLEASVDGLQSKRARMVVDPVPAVAFEGRRICFVMLRTLSLIELIESA